MGIINKNLKNVELYFMCEIEDATIPKKELFIGKKYTYAVKYLKETNFYKSKCKISEELSKVFEKMALAK